MLNYRPLTFFWIAEFSDDSALPQFDPETGKENKADPDWLPSKPDQPPIPTAEIWKEKRIVRFGWYPFSLELAKKINNRIEDTQIVIPTCNHSHVIKLRKGEKVIAHRTNAINFSLCGGISRGETVYVLGKVGEKVLRIREDGSVE